MLLGGVIEKDLIIKEHLKLPGNISQGTLVSDQIINMPGSIAVLYIWGLETSEYSTIKVYFDDIMVVQRSGNHGYWGKQDLALTLVIPANIITVKVNYSRISTMNYSLIIL